MKNENNTPTPPIGNQSDASTCSVISRRDYFAAHALQGILASGQFTESDGGELWAKLERKIEPEPGESLYNVPAVELAWRMADWMIRGEH